MQWFPPLVSLINEAFSSDINHMIYVVTRLNKCWHCLASPMPCCRQSARHHQFHSTVQNRSKSRPCLQYVSCTRRHEKKKKKRKKKKKKKKKKDAIHHEIHPSCPPYSADFPKSSVLPSWNDVITLHQHSPTV